jgi:hypothetical protein
LYGDGADARAALAAAKDNNSHVLAYLSGEKKMPERLPAMFDSGDESEAILYVDDYGSGWRKTPNAIEWVTSR